MSAVDPLDLSVRELLDETATESATPAGGAAAAVLVGLAAALTTMAARYSREDWPDAAAAVAQAETLRARAAPLAAEDVAAYDEVLRLRRESADDHALGRALERAAEAPLRIAAVAADVAELATYVAGRCDPAVQVDAVAAADLAAAGARIGARLVAVNLTMRPRDERIEEARRFADQAGRAAAARDEPVG
jgi:methenyltetrahydrofolate cyclohydrolase